MNACIDALSVYRTSVANQPQSSGLLAPYSLRLLPLFILAIMKHVGAIFSECYRSSGYKAPLLRWRPEIEYCDGHLSGPFTWQKNWVRTRGKSSADCIAFAVCTDNHLPRVVQKGG